MANEKRLIDANELSERIKSYAGMFTDELGFVVSLEAVIRGVDFSKTVDAVEVVRCKECYYFTEHNDFRSGRHLGYGECHRLRGELFKDEDFCSYGERKDND